MFFGFLGVLLVCFFVLSLTTLRAGKMSNLLGKQNESGQVHVTWEKNPDHRILEVQKFAI